MNWNEIVEKITPFIVKIETQQGTGTGFLYVYNETRGLCGFATANHVIEEADRWRQPIRIHHPSVEQAVFLEESDRVIYTDPQTDSAVVLLPVGELKLPEQLIPLLPRETRLPIGVEVAWLGYPSVARTTLCFFAGNVSAWQGYRHAYLIDGVTINGISGGPVLYSTASDGVQIVGVITAYMVNRATGEALPGLSFAQDVSHFHGVATHVKNIDEANRIKAEQQAKKQAEADASTVVTPESTPAKPDVRIAK